MSRQGCDTKCTHCKTVNCLNSAHTTKTQTPIVSYEEIKCLETLYLDNINSSMKRHPWSLRRIWNHIRCGQHSNIPLCCILFFIVFWTPLFYLLCFKPVKWFINWYPPIRQERFNYVPCPFCLVFNRRRKLKICGTDCWCKRKS